MDAMSQELLEGVKGLKEQIGAVVSEQNTELKKFGHATKETRDKMYELESRLDEKLDKVALLEKKFSEMELSIARPSYANTERQQGLFETIISHKNYQDMKETKSNSMRKIPLSALSGYPEYKALTSGLSDMREVLATMRPQMIYHEQLLPAQRIKDLFVSVQTDAAAIQWLREVPSTGFTNAAAIVPEGNTKPESALAIEPQTMNFSTIAHLFTVTNQILDDLPIFRDHVVNRMMDGLKMREDQQLLYGTGTSSQILGIFNTDIQLQVQGTDTRLDTIRKAYYKVDLAYYKPDFVVLHPFDLMTMELNKDGDKNYIWSSLASAGETSVWRTPIITSKAMAINQGLIGNFRGGAARIYDKNEATFDISESHATNFAENKVTMRLEERLAMVVYLPEAFCELNFNNGTNY